MTHDQNFKNLILDYPREALAFFAAEEAANIDPDVRIVPIRQEQLQERLGERFRELDVPLLVEWPDGRREAILFARSRNTQGRPKCFLPLEGSKTECSGVFGGGFLKNRPIPGVSPSTVWPTTVSIWQSCSTPSASFPWSSSCALVPTGRNRNGRRRDAVELGGSRVDGPGIEEVLH